MQPLRQSASITPLMLHAMLQSLLLMAEPVLMALHPVLQLVGLVTLLHNAEQLAMHELSSTGAQSVLFTAATSWNSNLKYPKLGEEHAK